MPKEIPLRPKCLVPTLAFAGAVTLLAQGVAVPKRQPRALPKIEVDIPLPAVSFEDVATEAGLTGLHVSGGATDQNYILETTGSGVALFDYDSDGFLDVFLVNGSRFDGFPEGKEPLSYLYHNQGDGTFQDVTRRAGLLRSGWGQGVCVSDYDNDGDDDLFVTYYGQNALYRNKGNGTFSDVTKEAGLLQSQIRWNTGCSFLDYDRDGDLDLFVANYVDFDRDKVPGKGANRFCRWKGLPVMCGPRGLPGGKNILYRNVGGGVFEDVSEPSGITKSSGYPIYCFAPLVSDYDNDGWPDIYVACDSVPSLFYHNEGDGTFTEIGMIAGCAFNEHGQEQAGMGTAAGDYDGDGFMDIVKTNFSDDTSTLYHNNRDGTFTDDTYSSGLGVNIKYLGWGTGFFDIDHDGWKDIFMVNGHVYPDVERAKAASPYKQKSLVYWNLRNGTFLDISSWAGPAINESRCSRGAALGDLDNDGSLEIVISNMNDTPNLLKNSGSQKNWILVRTLGTKSNRNGIGARVQVYADGHTQTDEVRSGGSYLSQNDLRLHFGLGDAKKVERIEVRWPTGKTEVFENLEVNRLVTLEEGEGAPKPEKQK